MKKVIFVSGLCLLLTSCFKENDNFERISISPSSLLADANLSSSEKAEGLAKQSETLLTAQGFQESNAVADLALQQDPKNLRAQFVKALLGPLMLQKGIFSRYMPLAKKDPRFLQEYNSFISQNGKIPESALKKFLLGGAIEFSTEAEVQTHLISLYDAFERLRIFSKNHKNEELTIKSNLDLTPDLFHRYAKACEIKETSDFGYELKCPPSEKKFDITINRADFETIEAVASMFQVYIGLVAAYDYSGTTAVKGYYYKKPNVTSKMFMDAFLKHSNFGKLRRDNKLGHIKGLLFGAVSGLRWAMARQDVLCPKGSSDSKNRIGMLVNVGVCVHPSFASVLDGIEDSIKGLPKTEVFSKDGRSYSTQVVHLSVLDNPYSDLRQTLPITFDACGQVESVGDKTLAGTYPKGDANIVIPLGTSKCRK